jgi:hypothetical protein
MDKVYVLNHKQLFEFEECCEKSNVAAYFLESVWRSIEEKNLVDDCFADLCMCEVVERAVMALRCFQSFLSSLCLGFYIDGEYISQDEFMSKRSKEWREFVTKKQVEVDEVLRQSEASE